MYTTSIPCLYPVSIYDQCMLHLFHARMPSIPYLYYTYMTITGYFATISNRVPEYTRQDMKTVFFSGRLTTEMVHSYTMDSAVFVFICVNVVLRLSLRTTNKSSRPHKKSNRLSASSLARLRLGLSASSLRVSPSQVVREFC